jgi:DNA-binding CsgD family transcriptional regulator
MARKVNRCRKRRVEDLRRGALHNQVGAVHKTGTPAGRRKSFRKPAANNGQRMRTQISHAQARAQAKPSSSSASDGVNGLSADATWRAIEASPTTWLLLMPSTSGRGAARAVHGRKTIEIDREQEIRLRAILREIADAATASKGDETLSPPDGQLTQRQAEIARMVRNGASNKVIARALGLTVGTVKVHLHRIYRVLGISSRVELAIRTASD